MKHVALIFLMCLVVAIVSAQSALELVPIDTAEVPQSVIQNHNMYFTGATATDWHKQIHMASSDSTGNTYIATFVFQGYPTQAQYSYEGNAIAASMQVQQEVLPDPVKALVDSQYGMFDFVKGQNIRSMQSGMEIFKITLTDGAEEMVLYADDKGKEIDHGSLPSELK